MNVLYCVLQNTKLFCDGMYLNCASYYLLLIILSFQKVTYNTKKPTIDLRAVAEVEGPGVKGGHKGEWKEQIIVPSLPLSSLTGGNLIEINYYIQVHF